MAFGVNQSIPTNTAIATLQWLETFISVLTVDPVLYGFTAVEAADVQVLVTDFRDEYDIAGVVGRIAVNPAGYTKPGRAAMFASRDAALSMVRPMAFDIHGNPGITDMDKLAIGIVPRNFARTPIAVPGTQAILGFNFAAMLTHTIGFADLTTPASKRKPFGATGLQLFLGIGAVETPLDQLGFYQVFSRNPAVIAFDAEDGGKLATYAGRWMGTRGDVAPFSGVITATIMSSQVPV